MFTGIVDHCGKICEIKVTDKGLYLGIESQFDSFDLGESIAVDGICLTVIEHHQHIFYVDISPETLKLTTAGQFQLNQPVNLEKSLRLQDRLGGHFVMGHVDGTARVVSMEKQGEFTTLKITGISAEQRRYLCKKGSVAINGVSLTINETYPDGFAVMLIPHTLQRTMLQFVHTDHSVNIEFDYVARILVEQANLNHGVSA